MSDEYAGVRYPWLVDALHEHGVVVTANRRLARELVSAWAGLQLAGGKTTWMTPGIFSWQSWLARLAAGATDPAAMPRRLDATAADILWERCLVRRMPAGVLGINGVVRQAASSWSRLNEWDVGVPALLSTAASQDEKWFAGAAADYNDLLETGNWTDGPRLAAHVVDALESGVIAPPPKVTLAGFDRRSPMVAKMLAALSKQDCEVGFRDSGDPLATPEITEFDDSDAELRAAGAWARQVLEDSADANIAIVCPGLESGAGKAVRCVREGLLPGWQLDVRSQQSAVEVSFGRRLSEYPAIGAALRLLRWTSRGLSGAELSPLILTPFIRAGGAGSRERMELSVRQLPDREWNVDAFLDTFGDAASDSTDPTFTTLAGVVQKASDNAKSEMPPSECIRIVDELLEECGWPGDRALDSPSFQLVNRWRELLNDFARVESVAPTIRFDEAIQRIESLASETVWQPEAEPGVVQVLGGLEAAGMSFDAIWVAGMNAGHWPPPSRPAPFIAVDLQRQRKMPDATPADTLEYARRTLKRLVASAPHCVLSWSRAEGDAEQIRSTLLEEFRATDYKGPADPGWFARRLCNRSEIEEIDGDTVRPVESGERVWGGAYTIQRQFREPFSALVSGRFGVQRPETFVTGLSPGVRGNIIHNALHALLQEKPALGEVREWTPEEITRRVGAAVDSALAEHMRHADAVLSSLIGFERERVRRLLTDFLASEADRDPGIQVVATELALSYERSNVTLGLRVDRVDRLPDGRLLIIDYKTGSPKHFLKQTDELRDVQPVLYADAISEPTGGLAFLNVDSRAITWKSAIRDPADEDDRFDDRLDGWKQVTCDTVDAFAAGDVRVNVLLTSAEARPLAILSRIEEHRRDQ